MCKVEFDEVAYVFHDIWCDSEERLFHEIAWDCLDKAGMTTYHDDRTHALIHIYAQVIQMMCDEFSYMAFDEPYSYDFESWAEEVLNEAAIGWLYRDSLTDCDNINHCFSMDADDMFVALIKHYRYTVADPIFKQLYWIGELLYFSICGALPKDDEDEAEPKRFETKENLIKYCKSLDFYFVDLLEYFNGMKVQHWLDCNSCAIDD